MPASKSPSPLSFSDLPNLPILVTGAAGFIGARFVETCNQRGIPMISVDHREHFGTRPEHRGFDFGQTLDTTELVAWLARERPALRAIVHQGAISSTTEFDWAKLQAANVDFSQALWNYCRETRIPFVYASSAATYGDGEGGYSDDEATIERLRPLNPYGKSKHVFDLWALEQDRRGLAPPAWSGWKFFNVYGFGERHKGAQSSVVLHSYDQIRAVGFVKLFKSHRAGIADGDQRRDFVAVEDVVDMMWFGLEKPIRRGIFNAGTGQARSFLDLARATFRALGAPERIEYIDMPEAIRDKYQYFTQAEMQKLRAEGYPHAPTTLEAGVERYVSRLKATR